MAKVSARPVLIFWRLFGEACPRLRCVLDSVAYRVPLDPGAARRGFSPLPAFASAVGGEQTNRFAVRAEDAEVAFVERQDVLGLVAIRQDDDRRVREADGEIGVALDDGDGVADVRRRERLERYAAAPRPAGSPGQSRRRAWRGGSRVRPVRTARKQRRRGGRKARGRLGVPSLRGVERRKQPAGVDQDHSPKRRRARRRRARRAGSPLSNSGIRSVGADDSAVAAIRAWRTTSASPGALRRRGALERELEFIREIDRRASHAIHHARRAGSTRGPWRLGDFAARRARRLSW